nr:MAG TPA: hypothetical protein [Caudoviricetes sp.]
MKFKRLTLTNQKASLLSFNSIRFTTFIISFV